VAISRLSTPGALVTAVLVALASGAGAPAQDAAAQEAAPGRPLPLAGAPARPAAPARHPRKAAPDHHVAESATPAVAQPDSPARLPNGAASITETYGDWTIDCRIENGRKVCALSQAQGNKETGRRVFALELRTPKDGKTEGTVLMPFGLNLDAGALLKLDDKNLGKGLRFSTCMPQGCLMPVSFPTAATDAMKTAKTLLVVSLGLSSNQAVTFKVSLNGFAAALARVSELGK
jgi:invasion protein IalB